MLYIGKSHVEMSSHGGDYNQLLQPISDNQHCDIF